jgi:hypothetical protein
MAGMMALGGTLVPILLTVSRRVPLSKFVR